MAGDEDALQCESVQQGSIKSSQSNDHGESSSHVDKASKTTGGSSNIRKYQENGNQLLPKWQLLLVSCTIYATQFSYAIATAYVIPIFYKLNMNMTFASMIWSISPILCLIFQPKVAILSHGCHSRMGRRRPFVLIFAVGVIIGLIFIANGESIGRHAHTDNDHYHPWGIVFTALGVVLTDFSTDTCQIATRSYMLDVTPSTQRQFAINLFAVVAGFGSCLAYMLSAIDWLYTLDDQIQVVFNIAIIMFVICIGLTLISMREPSTRPSRGLTNMQGGNRSNGYSNNHTYQQLETDENQANRKEKYQQGESNSSAERRDNNEEEDDDAESYDEITDQDLNDSQPITFFLILKSFLTMPKPLLLLCITQFFGWSAFVSYQLFFTQYVGQVIYIDNHNINFNFNINQTYFKTGIQLGCWALLLHFISYSILAFLMKFIINLIDIRIVYILSQFTFAVAMAIIGSVANTSAVLVLSALSGLHLAALISLPFMLVSSYQNSVNAKNSERETLGGGKSFFIPQWRIDLFIAALTSLAYVAQAVVCLIMGGIITASGTYNAIIVVAGVLAGLSTICSIILAVNVSPTCCSQYNDPDHFSPMYTR
ncbi:Membrane-associated transporter protein [Trichoplax sp. H2]|nr:Membrane-associated transporter protein [Trichoplax sp. H2]|eukprot:RDD45627.1 Membrane-associated transporter protein [Trichoplax sp. H2]